MISDRTPGDPQSAVAHLGDVVLFLQVVLARYQVSYSHSFLTNTNTNHWQLGAQPFSLGDRKLSTLRLLSAGNICRDDGFKGEDISAYVSWYKALFDPQSEGIEDSILR